MYAGVPQFIDIEDKIAFGLTAKQLLWLGGGVALIVFAYNLFDRQLFYVVALVIGVIFGMFTFWKPQGVTLITFLSFTLFYFFKPRRYVWKRIYMKSNIDEKKASLAQLKNARAQVPTKHLPSRGQLKRIAWELDTKK